VHDLAVAGVANGTANGSGVVPWKCLKLLANKCTVGHYECRLVLCYRFAVIFGCLLIMNFMFVQRGGKIIMKITSNRCLN